MKTSAEAAEAMSAITGAAAADGLTIGEATGLSRLVSEFSQTLVAVELEQRITTLEQANPRSR